MANTYSSSLRLIIQQDGTNQGTWGGYTNTNIASLIEQAITGVGAITVSGSSDHTLTVTNGASDEARNAILNITGTLTADINVICPTAAKTYIVKNDTTGGFAITLKTSAGTGISVPNGSTALLYCNGTSVVEGVNYSSGFTAANLTYTGALTGGTGVVNIGSGQIYKDASGNVGIGTRSPTSKFEVSGNDIIIGQSFTNFYTSDTAINFIDARNSSSVPDTNIFFAHVPDGSSYLSFDTTPAGSKASDRRVERMRIDSSGRLLLGTTSVPDVSTGQTGFSVSSTALVFSSNSNGGSSLSYWRTQSGNSYISSFWNGNTNVGNIAVTTTSTTYNTSSDYRLKEDIQPMQNALAKVAALKPCTYKWKVNGVAGEGFIAHELQAVVPGCVTGEKDAVDAEGNPQYQGIDTSFLVATLTAAIQEQQAIIESLTARIKTLEAK